MSEYLLSEIVLMDSNNQCLKSMFKCLTSNSVTTHSRTAITRRSNHNTVNSCSIGITVYLLRSYLN